MCSGLMAAQIDKQNIPYITQADTATGIRRRGGAGAVEFLRPNSFLWKRVQKCFFFPHIIPGNNDLPNVCTFQILFFCMLCFES